MKTLIALLGRSPGVVTGAFYALREQPADPVDITHIIVVGTSSQEARDCERFIVEELNDWVSRKPGPVMLQEPAEDARYSRRYVWKRATNPVLTMQFKYIKAADLKTLEDNKEFQEKITEVLEREGQKTLDDSAIYLGLAGGRKSMAALTFLSAQLAAPKVRIIPFHLLLTNEKLEENGDIKVVRVNAEWRKRCLHPQPNEYALAFMPFFTPQIEGDQLRLVLQGEVDTFIYRYVRKNPKVLDSLLDNDKDRLYSFRFEVNVRDLIEQKGMPDGQQHTRVEHDHHIPGYTKKPGDIDVYVVHDTAAACEITAIECKYFRADRPATDADITEKITQISDNLAEMRDCEQAAIGGKAVNIRPWVVTNAESIAEDSRRLASERGVTVWRAVLPNDWQKNISAAIVKLDEVV